MRKHWKFLGELSHRKREMSFAHWSELVWSFGFGIRDAYENTES